MDNYDEITELERMLHEKGLTLDDIERMELDAVYICKIQGGGTHDDFVEALKQIAYSDLN